MSDNNLDLFKPFDEITALKKETMDKAKKPSGCQCPVCDQFVKVYTRPMNGRMVELLVLMWKKHGELEYFHIPTEALDLKFTVGDFAKLRYWGLISEKPHPSGKDGRNHSGWWKITHAGTLFVTNKTFIPKYVVLYNKRKIDMLGDRVNVTKALGEKFDYNKLFEEVVL